MLGKGISIGRIFGIRITLDWSLLFIFLIVTMNLGAGVFPHWHPDWHPTLTWGVATAAAVLLWVSILVHELSHSLVARRFGIPVSHIRLFLFGGMANVEKEPPSPRSEFWMAFVGPLTSVAIGVIFIVGGSWLGGLRVDTEDPLELMRQMGPLATLLMWLGPINITLGLFNMLPGFPLDGGRVLRAALWAVTKDLERATRWAAGAGQVLGWMFIFGGVSMIFGVQLPFFGTGVGGGLWLALIGWFLNSAAIGSYQQVVLQGHLEHVAVGRLMRRKLVAASPDLPLSRFVDEFIMGSDERAFAVVANERLAGMVCLSDIRKVPRSDWDFTPVRTVMTPRESLEVAAPHEDAWSAMEKLRKRGVGQLPVVDERDRVVGMLRLRDILRWLEIEGTDRPAEQRPFATAQ